LYVMAPMQRVVTDKLRADGERDSTTVSEAISTLNMAYDMIERHVQGRRWTAGEDFSIADCAAAPALFFAAIVAPFPNGHTQLIEAERAVHDVAPDEAKDAFEIERAQDLSADDRRFEARCVAIDGRYHEIGNLFAPIVPTCTIGQLRRDVLAEQACHVSVRR